jgi:glycine hydroxymethyltransferase
VDQVEQIAIDRARQFFGAIWATIQPHSGAQANAAVMLAVLQSGDDILDFDLSHEGNLTHGSPVNFSDKLYKQHFYGVKRETSLIDWVIQAPEDEANLAAVHQEVNALMKRYPLYA